MTTYPRDHLTDAQAEALHAQFLAQGGLCDAWVDMETDTVTVTAIGAGTLVFLAQHMAQIQRGALRLVQW